MTAMEIMQAAEQQADAVAREPLPAVVIKDCRKCNGTGVFYLASGAPDVCNPCWGTGKVPATKEGKATLEAAKVERELKRLRLLWVGARDAIRARPSRHLEMECRDLMASVEARAVAVKADARLV